MSDSLFGPPSSRSWRVVPQSGGVEPESGVVVRPDSPTAQVLAAMRRGDACFLAGDFDGAAREFVLALDALDGRLNGLTVSVYLRLGRANQALERVTACLHCYKKGLEIDPDHAPTLRALSELHLEWHEHQAADVVEERLFECAGTTAERTLEMLRSGDRWWKRAHDPERAKKRYRRALLTTPCAMTPERQRVVARLRAISSATKHSELDALRQRARRARSDRTRAEAYFDLGTAAWFEARDYREAIHAFESAFVADRTLLPAMEMLVVILLEQRDYAHLERLCTSLAEATDAAGVAARATIREAMRSLPRDAHRSQQVRRQTLASLTIESDVETGS